MTAPNLQQRFEGCLLGLAVGDALGAKFEGQAASSIRDRFPTVAALIQYPREEIWYTDDTQMSIGVAEALVARGEIVEERLCAAFVENYVPSRGYGSGARAVLDVMEANGNYREVAQNYFPGGSYGNGAAMRVAPVGLFYRTDHPELWRQARLSALPTHVHQLGIEGAQLLAFAVALATWMDPFDREAFFESLIAMCESPDYRRKLERAMAITSLDEIGTLGNGIAATESVPTAIALFATTPDSYEETIGNAIHLGGDTDTIAAMAGALSGAFLGSSRLPQRLVNLLESGPKGGDYVRQLAVKLYEKHRSSAAE